MAALVLHASSGSNDLLGCNWQNSEAGTVAVHTLLQSKPSRFGRPMPLLHTALLCKPNVWSSNRDACSQELTCVLHSYNLSKTRCHTPYVYA
jgi:hypothetical protein